MTAPTPTPPIEAFAAALAALDRAVEACLRLAWEPAGALPPDERRRQAARLVSTYEQADRRADLLLAALIAGGGCSGLLEAVEGACHQALDRVVACYALRAGGAEARPASRALAVALHAEERAAARDALVRRAVVLPWARRRAGIVEEAA